MSGIDVNQMVDEPEYNQLEEGSLGHVQVVQIIFDTHIISYESLIKYCFQIHDPTEFPQDLR